MDRFEVNRRAFLATMTAAAGAISGVAPLQALGAASDPKPVRIGFIGVGGRGTGLLKVILDVPGVSIPSICDIKEDHLNRAIQIVNKKQGNTPEGYSKGPYDYRRMLERHDLDGILIATPMELHAEMAVDAMNAGKHVGSEVPGACTLKDCWALVQTKEKTGRRYMLLENYTYTRDRMMIGNMVHQDLFGETFYAECSYIHDCNSLRFESDGSLTWRGEALRDKFGNQYPTHSLGPVCKWMDINKTDRFVSLVSMESRAGGIQAYTREKFGPDSEQARIKWTTGGMNVTLIKTEKDRMITVYYDTNSPRPMNIFHLIQGTKGIFDSRTGIHIQGITEPEKWDSSDKYYEKYEHEYWKNRGEEAAKTGHGGGDYFSISDFVQMVRSDQEPTIDVYDSASWSAVIPLSQESIRKGSSEVKFPNFLKNRA